MASQFTQTRFLGATVTSFTSSVGWNEQSSLVTINLVEDVRNGDQFIRPTPGVPAVFQFGQFEFQGLIQRWLEKRGFDGNPIYEVTLTDPREILAGAQVILDSFRGAVNAVPNLLNAYGLHESVMGFGGSLVNDSGMVWHSTFDDLMLSTNSQGGMIIVDKPVGPIGIMPAIQTLTAGVGNIFGGPLEFMGHKYKVDLSPLPLPPTYYRIGGVSASILDMVNQVCQDGGSDYICILKGDTITFKVASRRVQPSIGSIANFINSQTDATNKSSGLELRNDITSQILLGGDIISLWSVIGQGGTDTTIWPYWGLDVFGQVIVGQGDPAVSHTALLNASAVADIVGDVVYKVDIAELRCAAIDFDSWSAYVLINKPDVGQILQLASVIDSKSDLADLFPDVVLQHDLITDDVEDAAEYGMMNESDYWTQRAQRMYEFVRQYATDYFGRRFLVRIPFLIYWKYEAETTHIVSSDEPADAGYTADGSMPLGLQFLNETNFLSQDGRFECFVAFPGINPETINFQTIPADAACMQENGTLYVKAQIDQEVGIVYPPGSIFPYVVVNLSAPVYELAPDPLGGVEDVATILGLPVEVLDYATGLRYGSFPVKISPPPFRPSGVALPLKSNRDSYGPWSLIGAPGKVSLRRDEGLVPWNYGDYSTMNLAARSMLASSATFMQIGETGGVELVGAPIASLGDTLVADGPNITGIDVSYSISGVTTNYRMQTFTPRFGAFTSENAARLRRLGLAAQDMRRAVRALFQKRMQMQQLLFTAQAGFLANTSRAVAQSTPHSVIVGNVVESDQWGMRTQVALQTPGEALANIRADNDDFYKNTGVMSLEGVFRPVSCDTDLPIGSGNIIPHYEEPVSGTDNKKPNLLSLNPMGSVNDIDLLAWGDSFEGFHSKKKVVDYTKARILGLRGPIVVAGYGFDYAGKPVPNKETDPEKKSSDLSNDFLDDYRVHSESWKAGPVGLFWDNWRKIWTIPTFLVGTLDNDLPTNGSTTMTVDGTGGDTVTVYETLGSNGGNSVAAKKDTKIVAAYDQLKNQWFFLASGCNS